VSYFIREATAVGVDLERVVGRFCAQLQREGYWVDRERAGDLHLVLARDREGEVAGHYVASTEEDGVHIAEIRRQRS
jgi:hypothetical protein